MGGDRRGGWAVDRGDVAVTRCMGSGVVGDVAWAWLAGIGVGDGHALA